MFLTKFRFVGALAVIFTALTLGCNDKTDHDKPGEDAVGHDDDDGHDHSAHEHGDEAESEVEEALAALSAEDRKLAEAQKTCPVSGEPLGEMGTPIKMTVKGQAIFICCEACRKPLEKNPDKYLAKLNK